MNIQSIPATRLNAAAYNPRKDLKPGDKDFEKLKRSIAEFGYIEPVIWNIQTGNVVGGHQRLKVLLEMGRVDIDCVVVDLDLQREKALNLALNKVQGDWDEGKLAVLMADLDTSAFDISLTGFDAQEVDALMNRFYSKEAVEDGFDEKKAREDIETSGGPVSRQGTLWQLGHHRLLCGDAASPDDFTMLMSDAHAQCTVTSPPIPSVREYIRDGMTPWLERMEATVRNMCNFANVICWHLGDLFQTGSQFMEPTGFHSMKLFADCNYRPLWVRVWKKEGAKRNAGSQHTTSNKPVAEYEYVTAFAGQEQEAYNDQEYTWISAFAAHSFQFVRRLTKEERRNWGYTGIWEFATAGSNDKAVTLPVELPWRCLKMHSDVGGLVIDPFAGTGTTLIAAEQSGRRCYTMEADPILCDLAIKRWEEWTGEKAVLLSA